LEDYNDVILSGILYVEDVKIKYPYIFKRLNRKKKWTEFCSIIILDKIPLLLNNFIIQYVQNESGETPSPLFKQTRKLIDSMLFIWKLSPYKNRSTRINESTYSHDAIAHITSFLNYEFEDSLWIRW